MTKLQNTKNERNADVSKTLTEQMKIGKLPEGYYYLKLNPDFEDRYCVAYNMGMDFDLYAKGFDIDEVLAPVPSYEEYEQLENWNGFTSDYHALREAKEIAEYEKFELVEQMKQLKELLKEVLRHELSLKEVTELTRKIDQVLGEE